MGKNQIKCNVALMMKLVLLIDFFFFKWPW